MESNHDNLCDLTLLLRILPVPFSDLTCGFFPPLPQALYAVNNNLKFAMQLFFKPTTTKMLGNLKVFMIAVLMTVVMKRRFNIIQVGRLAIKLCLFFGCRPKLSLLVFAFLQFPFCLTFSSDHFLLVIFGDVSGKPSSS